MDFSTKFDDDNKQGTQQSSAVDSDQYANDETVGETPIGESGTSGSGVSVDEDEGLEDSCHERQSETSVEKVDDNVSVDETGNLIHESPTGRRLVYPATLDPPRSGILPIASGNDSADKEKHETESGMADRLEKEVIRHESYQLQSKMLNSKCSSSDMEINSEIEEGRAHSAQCHQTSSGGAHHSNIPAHSSKADTPSDRRLRRETRDTDLSSSGQSDTDLLIRTNTATAPTSQSGGPVAQPQVRRNRTEASTTRRSVPGALAMPGRLVSELNSYEHMTNPTTLQRSGRSTGTVNRLITQIPPFSHERPILTSSLVDDDDDDNLASNSARLHQSTTRPMLPVFEAELVVSAAELDNINATRRSFMQGRTSPELGETAESNARVRERVPESAREESDNNNLNPSELLRNNASGGTTSSNSYEEDDSQDGRRIPASRRLSRSLARWPQYEYRQDSGTSVSNNGQVVRRRRSSADGQNNDSHGPVASSDPRSGGEDCCAIDVQIEPDPVSCLCWNFEGSNSCFTRRIPLIYAISVFCVWTALSVITLGLVATHSNRKINAYLASQSHDEFETAGLIGNETFALSGPGGSEALSRLNAIANVLSVAVASPWVFVDETTVQTQTLRWLAYEDPQALHYETQRKELVQRFSARVFVLSLLDVNSLDRRKWAFQDEDHECNWNITKVFMDDSDNNHSDVSVYDDTEDLHYYEVAEMPGDTMLKDEKLGIAEESSTFTPEEKFEKNDKALLDHDSSPPPRPIWSISSRGDGCEHDDGPVEPTLSFQCNAQREIVGITIAGVFISSTLPKELSNLRGLQSLSIRRAAYATSSRPSFRPPSLIPPLANLDNLTSLELEVDDFSSIEGISGLRQMEHLNIHIGGMDNENALVPDEIGRLWGLKHLHLHRIGVVPNEPLLPKDFLHDMDALEAFCVYGCRFVERRGKKGSEGVGGIESDGPLNPGVFDLSRYVGSLKSIKNISFVECEGMATGPFPSNVGNLPKLRHLALPGMIAFNSSLPTKDDFWRKLENLVHLDLRMNGLEGHLPSTGMTFLKNLEVLKLGGNHLKGRIPSEFSSHVKNLRYLDLSSNKLTGDVPDISLDHLSTLLLQENMLSGPVFGGLCGCSKLTGLSLGRNKFENIDEECAGRLQKLEVVTLASNNISTSIPWTFCEMENLKALQIAYAGVSGSIPTCVGQLRKLRAIDLERNELTGSIPAELVSLPDLTSLELTKNHLNGSLPLTLCRATNLKTLALGGNRLSSTIPACIGEMHHLRLLLLDNNMLTGPLPPRIGNLKDVKRIDLGANMLSSSIPTGIGKLSSVEALILGENKLTGEIPHTIGNLPHLNILDLGFNELEGSVPSSFENLDYLEKMSLVRNKNMTGNLDNFCSTRVASRGDGESDGVSSAKDIARRSKRAFSSSSSSSDYNVRRGLRRTNPHRRKRQLGSKSGKKGKAGLKQIPMYFVDEGVSCSCCLPIDFPCPFPQNNCDWLSYRPGDIDQGRPNGGPGQPHGGENPAPYGPPDGPEGWRADTNETSSNLQSHERIPVSFTVRRSRPNFH